MKVWNQEITACWMCPYYDFPIGKDDIGYMCTVDEHMIEKDFKNSQIHKDCPFNKSISKKSFEDLGFKETFITSKRHFKVYSKGSYDVMETNDNMYTIINKKTTEVYFDELELLNPEELKFILKKLKIIE